MGIYIQPADVHGKSVDEPLTAAKWDDTIDVPRVIVEAESYVEGRLLRIGYSRGQLQLAPATPAPLVFNLCVNYARYCALRDIFSNLAPQEGTGERYDKWLKNVEDIFTSIEDGKTFIIDNNGNIISPAAVDSRYKVLTTTPDVPQAIKMGNDSHWKISHKYEKINEPLPDND